MGLRAYQRIDPRTYERKVLDQGYPLPAFAAYIGALNAGEAQPDRGRFRTEAVLRALLGPAGRWVGFLVERGDLVRLPDGRLYLEGWDEWQEGDWKVAERVTRIRNRKRTPSSVADVTVETVTHDTVAPVYTPSDGDRLTAAVSAKRDSPSVGTSGGGSGGVSGGTAPADDVALVAAWLARERKAWVPEGAASIELARLVDQHGVPAVLAVLGELDPSMRDGRQYVYGAMKRLNPLPAGPRNGKAVAGEYRPSSKEAADAFERF